MKKLLLYLLLPVLAAPAYGQAVAATTAAPETQTFFTAPETVLPLLFEAAIVHSAEIERLDAAKAIASEDIQLVKKKTLNMFSVSSSYNYGTLPYFATADATSRVYQINPFAQGARAQYSAGLNVVAPLDQLFGRRNAVHRQELVLSEAVAERKQQEAKIRQTVITQYQELVYARAALQHFQDALQSADVSRKIADKRFREAEIQVDEQMTAMDLYGRAKLAHEQAKSQYQTARLLLEDLIGMPITNLMPRK
jgi:outer membrane protein TolC